MKPPGGNRINAADIVKEELKNKIEEVVDKLIEQGADEDDAREMIKSLVDKELDVVAAFDKMAVWAEPPVERDFVPSMAEAGKEVKRVIKRKKKTKKVK
jgi:formate dehydrogenase maturation protein FdhE